jgi:anti-anti-sigma factor
MDLVLEPEGKADQGLTRVTVRGGVTFLVVQSNSIREHQSGVVDRELRGLEGQTAGRVAMCLSEVDDMCSAFINTLIESDHRCRQMGGKLVVFGLNHELQRLFRTTGLHKRLNVVRDCNQALRRLQAGDSRRLALFWSWFHRQAA